MIDSRAFGFVYFYQSPGTSLRANRRHVPVNPQQNQIGQTNLQDSVSKDRDLIRLLSNIFAPEYNLSISHCPSVVLKTVRNPSYPLECRKDGALKTQQHSERQAIYLLSGKMIFFRLKL